jgi:hypothetical protein
MIRQYLSSMTLPLRTVTTTHHQTSPQTNNRRRESRLRNGQQTTERERIRLSRANPREDGRNTGPERPTNSGRSTGPRRKQEKWPNYSSHRSGSKKWKITGKQTGWSRLERESSRSLTKRKASKTSTSQHPGTRDCTPDLLKRKTQEDSGRDKGYAEPGPGVRELPLDTIVR